MVSKKKRMSGSINQHASPSASSASFTSSSSSFYGAHHGPMYATSTTVADAVGMERPRQYSLEELRQHYHKLSANVSGYPKFFDRCRWFHNMVGLVLHNVIMYDTDIASEQLAVFFWSVLWIGRCFLLPHDENAPSAPRTEVKKRLLWRALLSGVCIIALVPLVLLQHQELPMMTLQMIAVLVALEWCSISMLMQNDGQMSFPLVVLGSLEASFVISTFSTQFSHKEFLIYDVHVFVLVTVSVYVHNFVLLSAKLSMRLTDADVNVLQSRQQSVQLLESLRDEIESIAVDGASSSSNASTTSATAPMSSRKKKKLEKLKQAKAATTGPVVGVNTPSVGAEITDQLMAIASSMQAQMDAFVNRSKVRMALLMMLQSVLLLVELGLSFVALSYEATSALMFSSSHIGYVLLQVRNELCESVSFQGVPLNDADVSCDS